MTWQKEIVEQTRVLIGDMDESPTYSDSRLERVVIIATNQVLQEIDFSHIYVVDISNQTIAPDPTEVSPKDTNFINLVAMKVACVVLQAELRKYALGSIMVTDGPSTISMGQVFSNIRKTYDTLMQEYGRAKFLYQCSIAGHAVTTPSTNTNVTPIQDF